MFAIICLIVSVIFFFIMFTYVEKRDALGVLLSAATCIFLFLNYLVRIGS